MKGFNSSGITFICTHPSFTHLLPFHSFHLPVIVIPDFFLVSDQRKRMKGNVFFTRPRLPTYYLNDETRLHHFCLRVLYQSTKPCDDRYCKWITILPFGCRLVIFSIKTKCNLYLTKLQKSRKRITSPSQRTRNKWRMKKSSANHVETREKMCIFFDCV